jgi:hypothetical protein
MPFPGQISVAINRVSTSRYEISGDTARVKSVCTNPMTVTNSKQTDTVVMGCWYVHDFVRTADGWKIKKLYEEKSYRLNAPAWLAEKLPA